MSSQTYQGSGGGHRGGARGSNEHRGRGGGRSRGGAGDYRGRGNADRGSAGSYQPGHAPYASQGRERGANKGYRGADRGGGRGNRGGKRNTGTFDGEPRDEQRKSDKLPQNAAKLEISAEDQFDLLFGGDGAEATLEQKDKIEESKQSEGDGNTDQLMDMLGVVLEDDEAANKRSSQPTGDDAAIVIEDDAIVVENEESQAPEQQADTKPKKRAITEDDRAILNAEKQSRPLWMEGERVKYSAKDILRAFQKEEEIDFDLFDKDYLSVFEVFNPTYQIPFNQETELVKQIDVKRFQEKPGGAGAAAGKRYQAAKGGAAAAAQRGNKSDWTKNAKANQQRDGAGLEDDDDEQDPEWIEFDAEKERTRFFGHVMEDEKKLREHVAKKKESKLARAEEKKRKAVELAKLEGMTDEQRNIIAESKLDHANIDKEKLKEAELLAAQIEAESFSKFDVDFESKAKRYRPEDTLTDEQLVDLFAEMKKETMAKREKEMQKFKVERATDGDEELLADFNDELEAMRGEDSEPDELNGLIDAAGNEYRKVGVAEPLTPRLGLFLPQDQSETGLEGDEQNKLDNEEYDADEREQQVLHYNEDVKNQLKRYREQKELQMQQTQQPTAQSNLEEIFKNFQVVTQQRHKIKLNEVNRFEQGTIMRDDSKTIETKGSLISSLFSQINPFAQFVIRDVFEESIKASNKSRQPSGGEDQAEDASQAKNWQLHESLFKRNPQHQVNQENLIKSSAQMFSVYKFYENPNLLVKSKAYTDKDDFVEVRKLVPDIQFYDAPASPSAPTKEARQGEAQVQEEVQVA